MIESVRVGKALSTALCHKAHSTTKDTSTNKSARMDIPLSRYDVEAKPS